MAYLWFSYWCLPKSKSLNFDEVHLINFFSFKVRGFCFLPNQGHKDFSPFFFSRRFIVSVLPLRSINAWINFLYGLIYRSRFIFSHIFSCLSTVCWKVFIFPILNTLVSCQNQLAMLEWVYFWNLFCSIDFFVVVPLIYVFTFMLVSHWLDYSILKGIINGVDF